MPLHLPRVASSQSSTYRSRCSAGRLRLDVHIGWCWDVIFSARPQPRTSPVARPFQAYQIAFLHVRTLICLRALSTRRCLTVSSTGPSAAPGSPGSSADLRYLDFWPDLVAMRKKADLVSPFLDQTASKDLTSTQTVYSSTRAFQRALMPETSWNANPSDWARI